MPATPAPAATHRIAKLLARAGVASRREIERMIADGRVALGGAVIDTPATLLASLDGVTVDGAPVAAATPARLFVYHKPAGLLVTERDPRGRPTIYDRLPADLPRVMPVGRLDLATEGLLLLTTDGELKRQLELPATGVERAYRARTYGPVSQAQLEELIDGVEIEGVRYGSIDANLERRTGANAWIELILTEGKNREVRRVLEYLGLRVSRLIRTRYGPFVLADLPPGLVGEVRGHDVASFRKNPTRKDLPQPARRGVAEPASLMLSEPARPAAGARSGAVAPRVQAARTPDNERIMAHPPAGEKPKRARPGRPKAGPRVRADGSVAATAKPVRAARAKAHRSAAAPRPSPAPAPSAASGRATKRSAPKTQGKPASSARATRLSTPKPRPRRP